MRHLTAVAAAVLLVGAIAIAVQPEAGRHTRAVAATPAPSTTAPTTTAPPTTTTTAPPPPPTSPPVPRAVAGQATLAGCPAPPPPPGPPPAPWHPAVLVPDSSLPPEEAPAPWPSDVGPVTGKGMWLWQFDQTEGGHAPAIVRLAVAAGLHQLWVRVADSRDGFYGAAELDALVGPAHQAGLAVIGWGFPYLYDPMGDAGWTAQALEWKGPGGDRLDGFSADIEKSTEGVALTERRAAVYLGAVRRAAGNRTIIATVYRPIDLNWFGPYPYTAIARYVDAFAPMVYWGCTDPGEAAVQTLVRLQTLRPVHLIGQAYNMGPEGGRNASPSADETRRFLDVGRRGGALGASFWSWQAMTAEEWNAMATFAWRR